MTNVCKDMYKEKKRHLQGYSLKFYDSKGFQEEEIYKLNSKR